MNYGKLNWLKCFFVWFAVLNIFYYLEWEKMTGYKASEVINKNFEFLQFHPNGHDEEKPEKGKKEDASKEHAKKRCLMSAKMKAYIDKKKNSCEPVQVCVDLNGENEINYLKNECAASHTCISLLWNSKMSQNRASAFGTT